MRTIPKSPKRKTFDTPGTDNWFDEVTHRFNIYSGTANPTASQVPQGQWVIYTNTTLGETRLWVNVGGTVKSSAAFT